LLKVSLWAGGDWRCFLVPPIFYLGQTNKCSPLPNSRLFRFLLHLSYLLLGKSIGFYQVPSREVILSHCPSYGGLDLLALASSAKEPGPQFLWKRRFRWSFLLVVSFDDHSPVPPLTPTFFCFPSRFCFQEGIRSDDRPVPIAGPSGVSMGNPDLLGICKFETRP